MRTAAPTLAPLFALALALLAPTASAADAFVALQKIGDAWNGESRVEYPEPTTASTVDVWVPSNARIQSVTYRIAESAGPATWSAAGPDVLRVAAPPRSSAIVVLFDVPERHPYLARYVAPPGTDHLTLVVLAPEGEAAQSPDIALADGRATTAITEGDTIAIQVVEEGRVGELPLLATIGSLAALVLLGTLAWHRMRPPLEGREPQKFLDHLSELQARLLPPAIVFAILNLFFFTSGLRAIDGPPYVLPTWGADASIGARAFDAVAERLVPPDVTLIVLRPADAVLAQVGMCLFLSLATILPLLLYEIAAFIAPGLEARERKMVLRTLPLVTGLFLLGALLAYLIFAPLMIRTLYSYAPGIGAQPLLAVGELVSFSLLVILALGIAFELPVAMYALSRLGLVKAKTFGRYLRHAILAIVVVAGLITPDPSVVSQLLLAVPIVALYLLGIAAAAMGERRARPT